MWARARSSNVAHACFAFEKGRQVWIGIQVDQISGATQFYEQSPLQFEELFRRTAADGKVNV